MSNEIQLSMAIPRDSDGFIRRGCPTCGREFKWFVSQNDDGWETQPAEGGYFCPYCGVQAPVSSWWTEAQLALARNTVAREAAAPLLRDFGRSLENIGRRSGGVMRSSFDYRAPEKMDPLTEDDDMKRIDFECHSSEPLKLLEDWAEPVYCLICGTRNI